MAATGPVISISSVSGSVEKVTPSLGGVVGELGVVGRGLELQLAVGVQIELGPLRARQRPFVLGARHEFLAGMADVEQHLGLLVPAVVDAFQEMVEELALQVLAVLGVEQREVGVAVHLQPFLLGAGAQVAFEIAAWMQSHAAPVGGGEDRRLDVLELRQPRLVIVIDQPMAQRIAVAVGAVLLQLLGATACPGRRPARR